MDDICETYRGIEIFETMTFLAGSDGYFDMPAHKFQAKINGEEISTRNQHRHKALNSIKIKIDEKL